MKKTQRSKLFAVTLSLLVAAPCASFHPLLHKYHDRESSKLWAELSRRDVLASAAAATTAAAVGGQSVDAEVTTIPTVRLGNSNLEVSRSIQGYWQLAGGHGRYRENDAIANMEAHYKAGFTTMDTADIYGPSETIIGKFLAKQRSTNGVGPIPCTKFSCFRFLDEIDRTEVRDRILKSCERLQVDKLPLVQFFWSNFDIAKYTTVGLYLAELKEEGLIQEIGATNFDLPRLKELKEAGVPIVSHQVQLSALDRRPIQSGMADWCLENKVSLTAFGTVGGGILSDRFLGRESAPNAQERNTASLRLYAATADRFGDWQLVQNLLKCMDAVALDVRERCPTASIANIAQRYVLDSTPSVASLVIGVRNPSHIAENVATHSFTLTEGERHAIDQIVSQRKGPQGDVWGIERGKLNQ